MQKTQEFVGETGSSGVNGLFSLLQQEVNPTVSGRLHSIELYIDGPINMPTYDRYHLGSIIYISNGAWDYFNLDHNVPMPGYSGPFPPVLLNTEYTTVFVLGERHKSDLAEWITLDLQAANYDVQKGNSFVIGFQGLASLKTGFPDLRLHPIRLPIRSAQNTISPGTMRTATYSDTTRVLTSDVTLCHRINVTQSELESPSGLTITSP